MQDAAGRIVDCNPAACRILGLNAEQMAGRSSIDPRWRAVHEDGSSYPGETHPAMRRPRTGRPSREDVMGVHKPDGSLSWISINFEPLLEPAVQQQPDPSRSYHRDASKGLPHDAW